MRGEPDGIVVRTGYEHACLQMVMHMIGPEDWAKPNTPCGPPKCGDVPPSPIKAKEKQKTGQKMKKKKKC
jgi:hypothetical protein